MTKEILRDIVEGDRDVYSRLYIEYFKKFYNYGKKFTADSSLIEDTIQEVFLDFWIKKEKLLKVENLASYFFLSFRYILLKKIKQGNSISFDTSKYSELEFSVDHIIINKEINEELHQKLQAALNTLTPHQREALFLRFYEGLSYEEVAAILNITVKATYKIMARSLSTLRDNIQLSLIALFVIIKLK